MLLSAMVRRYLLHPLDTRLLLTAFFAVAGLFAAPPVPERPLGSVLPFDCFVLVFHQIAAFDRLPLSTVPGQYLFAKAQAAGPGFPVDVASLLYSVGTKICRKLDNTDHSIR
jgi:hypothetical protein